MCILFLFINPRPKIGEYKAIIVNNRDETYNRPTKPAHFWDDRIVGGMDMEKNCEGGTWLAASKDGKISCLLNIFQPVNAFKAGKTSRGFLVVDYLNSCKKGHQYMEVVKNSGKMYNPFNLITLDPQGNSYDVNFYNSDSKMIHQIQPGFHGFGNSPLMKPLKKVEKGKTMFQDLVNTYGKKELEEKLIAELFIMMQNKDLNFPDPQLTEQGKGHMEYFVKSLSSIWVSAANYGTRTTTVILVDQSDQLVYKERTMQDPVNPENPVWGENSFTFTIVPTDLYKST
ncbi:transport and Golgi organization 2 homolog [Portunus trituberculatus]|uniref:transport and Golgi organization 2 homolog n=1 Tax=Portunus trituberculatus TaxID=210409 RepID=UPI001E1CCF4C|nr:transport and Golgi organization 2 homolog [Portunus trituberculatus]